MVGRFIGYLFSMIAIAAVLIDIINYIRGLGFDPISAGDVWKRIDLASLSVFQAGVERHLDPWLWDPVMVTILNAPLFAVAAIPGIILILVFRRRD
jgi:hypothetical protein